MGTVALRWTRWLARSMLLRWNAGCRAGQKRTVSPLQGSLAFRRGKGAAHAAFVTRTLVDRPTPPKGAPLRPVIELHEGV